MERIIDFVLNQSSMFIISALGLIVAGLSLVFGVSVLYFFHKTGSKN